MSNIRILIADDHQIVREGLTATLTPRIGMEVIGEAANGREALHLERQLKPDVVIMDLVMPDMNGLEATVRIRQHNPDAHILILTSFNDDEQIAQIMAAGASGYILKDSGVDDLLQAIRSVHSGLMIMSPTVMQAITRTGERQATRQSELIDLTPRELEVLQGIVDGLTNQAIAVRLQISATTVRDHVSAILAKLEVTNRTQAALMAREYELL